MSPDDLGQKLAVLKEQTKSRMDAQHQRHEQRKQEILLSNQLKAQDKGSQGSANVEVIQLQHELDVETRKRDRDDALFYGNIDLQDFIKRQQVTQSHLLEEIQHTTVATILEKAILMIVGAKLESKGGKEKHEQKKDEKTHKTTQQMRLEKFRAELTLQFGQDKADEVLSILENNIDNWEQETK